MLVTTPAQTERDGGGCLESVYRISDGEMADVESLTSLPRKEIQRQAKEAGIKANQTNEALISALCALRVSAGGQQDGASTHCTPKSGTPGSMGSARRAFGSELSASKANQPMAARRRLLKTLSEDCASPIAVEPPSSRKGLVLASPGLAMGMSPLVAHRLSTASLSSSAVPSPADWSRSKLAEPSFNSRSVLVEGDTVELTVARLRALGFGEEDARWAAEEAKVRQEEEGDEHDISLSLDLSCLRIDDNAGAEAEAQAKADKCIQEAESVFLNVAALNAIFSHLNTWDISSLTASTCRTWREASISALRNYPNVNSEDVGDVYLGTMAISEPATIPQDCFSKQFPWGRFLAIGGFKQVFLVHNASLGRTEAVSVMDLEAMADNGNLGVADTEVRIAYLLSNLGDRSHHFVQTFQLLRCSNPPPASWGNEEDKEPMGSLESFLKSGGQSAANEKSAGGRGKKKAKKAVAGDYQYIRMEYCTEGDLEEACRNNPNPPADAIRDLMVQMTTSLRVCYEELSMRHYDIKLLNFFLTRDEDTDSRPKGRRKGWYWDGASGCLIVKLADFGTADVEAHTFDQHLTNRQVTTWENCLPALLLFGTDCLQDYTSDMHGLGLSFLHLLIGDVPYEEAVEELTCPDQLASKWRAAWIGGKGKKKASGGRYQSVKALIEDDPESTTLEDTLYRNIVLLGHDLIGDESAEGPVVDALRDWASGKGKAKWQADVAVYSMFSDDGSKVERIARAREMMGRVRNGEALLRGMCDITGRKRLTYDQALSLLEA